MNQENEKKGVSQKNANNEIAQLNPKGDRAQPNLNDEMPQPSSKNPSPGFNAKRKKEPAIFVEDRFEVDDVVLLNDDPHHSYRVIGLGNAADEYVVESDNHTLRSVRKEELIGFTPDDIRALHEKLSVKKLEAEVQPLPERVVCAETYTWQQQEEAQRREKILLDFESKVIKTKEEAMEKMGLKSTAFGDVKRAYAKDPRWQSLVPKQPGRGVGENDRDPEVVELYMKAFDLAYWNDGATAVAIYPVFEELCRDAGKQPFSRSTAVRVFNEIDPRLRDLRKWGSDYVSKKYGAYPSDFELNGPLSRVQIDGTTGNIMLIDDETGKLLGRPYLTVVIDDYSSAFMAVDISFCSPSRATTAAAMYQALMNKRSLLSALGMNEEAWPVYGWPSGILVDRGSEFDNHHFQATCDKFGIGYEYRKRVQQGGVAEDGVKLLNTFFVESLEGSTGARPRGEVDFNPEAKAVYNLRRFSQMLYGEVIRLNNTVREVDRLTPIQRWESGLKRLGIQRPPALSAKKAEAFMINMLPGGRVQVRPGGIKYKGVVYDHGPTRALINRHKSVSVRRSPLNLHQLYVLYNGLWHTVRALKSGRVPRTQIEQQAMRRSRMLAGSMTPNGVEAHRVVRKLIITSTKEGKKCLRAKASVEQAQRMGLIPAETLEPSAIPVETNQFANVAPFKVEERS
jgi:putative transposase